MVTGGGLCRRAAQVHTVCKRQNTVSGSRGLLLRCRVSGQLFRGTAGSCVQVGSADQQSKTCRQSPRSWKALEASWRFPGHSLEPYQKRVWDSEMGKDSGRFTNTSHGH